MTMERSDLSTALQEAGLTEYQADAYLTLLDQGTSPAVEVARHCSVPAPRIYDVLKALEQRGFVETLERETLHARARHPSDVIEQLEAKSSLLSTAAGEIEERWERSPMGENELNMTKRAETVIEHAADIIREAEYTVDISVTADELAMIADALVDVDFEDVIVRVSLYRDPDDPATLEDVEIPDVVTEVRARTIPAPFLVVVDRTQVCFSPTSRLPDPYGLVVNDDIVSFVFQWYYETCDWTIWDPIHRRDRPTGEYVSLETFVVEAYPHWAAGETIDVEIDGVQIQTGDPRTVTGTVENITFTGQEADGDPTLLELAGEMAITVETDEGLVTVGSWAASLEDVEARRVTVTSGPLAGDQA